MTSVIAGALVSIIPSSSVFTVLSQSITYGLNLLSFVFSDDLVSGVIVMMLSYAGVGAILAASAEFFCLVKWFDIIYMVYLSLARIGKARKIKGDLVTKEVSMRQYGKTLR